MSAPTANAAIFISYAREDTVAADRLAEALRSHGLEVWFDQNELRGGDSWDQKIRGQIRTCTLIVPVVSANTQGRGEGYFRREWKLAAERTHDMAAGIPFLVPVVIDDTAESVALVPEEFMRVQWTRLPQGRATPQFAAQVKRLLEAPRGAAVDVARAFQPVSPGNTDWKVRATSKPPAAGRRVPAAAWIGFAAVIMIGVVAVFFATRKAEPASASTPNAGAGMRPPTAEKTSVAPIAPGKSIAVLPFANLSTEKENEFFADGVQDDVITNLAKIRDLTVISRSSTLAYRDIASRNLKKIAAELGVASVLEGSVQRDGNRVRINVQLIDARTDGHLWAETYNKELTDRFSMQAALTQEIAAALKATLTPSEKTLIERRPTENQEAYEIYQRARAISQEVGEAGNLADYERILALYGQALAKDSSFALAHVQSAFIHSIVYWFGRLDPSPARAEKTKAAAEAAIRLAPNAPESHLALGAYHYRVHRDWERALAEFRIAEAALPNDAQLSFWLAATHRRLGRWQDAVGYFERSATLGPRDLSTAWNYIQSLRSLRRWPQALAAAKRSLEIFPADRYLNSERERTQFMLDGDRDAYFRRFAALPALPGDPTDLQDGYLIAVARGDWAAADRALTDPRFTSFGDVIVEPVALRRAAVAFLRGDHAEARRFAEEASVSLRGGRWNERQQPWVRMAIAEAEGLAGQRADALRDADAAMAEVRARDAVDFAHLRLTLARIHLVLDQRDAAFASLRESLASFCDTTPNEFRLDPFWARVKNDPRFEEILKSAKAL